MFLFFNYYQNSSTENIAPAFNVDVVGDNSPKKYKLIVLTPLGNTEPV
jgi:hypothetical protein